jgi:hypothetical protein
VPDASHIPTRSNANVTEVSAGRPPSSRAKRLAGNCNARTHGTHTLKRAVKQLGQRTIDRRTTIGRALAAWRSELLADLGGIEAVSTQELALVEEAVKTKLILDSVDAWLLSQATLINKRNRSVLPAVRDRQALVSTLRGLLGDLGLKRRSKTMPALSEYLEQRAAGAHVTDGVDKSQCARTDGPQT